MGVSTSVLLRVHFSVNGVYGSTHTEHHALPGCWMTGKSAQRESKAAALRCLKLAPFEHVHQQAEASHA